jgi:hypothetical protein
MEKPPPEDPDALSLDIEKRHLLQPPRFRLGGNEVQAW